MNGLRELIHEIHRRSVWQVLGIYLVGSWVALQVVDVIGDNYGLPDWFPGFALALLVIGLPIVVATAFVQEGVGSQERDGAAATTPAASAGPGDPATATVEAGASPALHPLHRLLTWRNAIAGGLLAFGLWGVVATYVLLTDGRAESATNATADAAVAADGAEADDPRHAIAVLPFENLSPDPDNAFFADGVHEDVLTHLSKIGDLTVISRTSVMTYRGAQKPMSQIGSELGVGAIVEGSVRRAGDQVRITAQLIDARTDEHLWADSYDRQLSAASVFSIQTEIAQMIADALAATLTPQEAQRIARSPTESLEALDYYLRGRAMYGRYSSEGNEEAIRLFGEALALDPDYADAWAGLSDAYGQLAFQFGQGREWADSAEAAARRSLELDPELAAGYKAMGLAYTAQGKIQAALEANRRAVDLDPNHLSAIGNIGVHYGGFGRHDEAMRWIRRAQRLDPANTRIAFHLAVNWIAVGEVERGERIARERLRLDPSDLQAIDALCWAAQERGDPDAAECSVERVLSTRDDPESRLAAAAFRYLAGDYRRASELAQQVAAEAPDIILFRHVQTLLGTSLALSDHEDEGRRVLLQHRADLSRRVESSEDGRWLLDLAALDAFLGNAESSLDALELAHQRGSWPTRARDLDPAWDALRDHPRWTGLMERWDADLEEQRQRMLAEWGDAG